MSIETELQQALDTIDSMEQHTADAYAALKQNGASLPAKCNIENLAGAIAEGTSGKYSMKMILSNDNGAESEFSYLSNEVGKTLVAGLLKAFRDDLSYSNMSVPYLSLATDSYQKWAVLKKAIYELTIDLKDIATVSHYLVGGNSGTTSCSGIKRLKIVNATTIGNNVGACAFSGEDDSIELNEGITNIGSYFLSKSRFKGKLKIPSTVETIASPFCRECDNIMGIFIPAGVAPPLAAGASSVDITAASKSAPAYINGVILSGPGAKAWKVALPDRSDAATPRKLILDPEWA